MKNATIQCDSKRILEGNASESQIRKFYAGKSVLLTGCTGFLGTAILEKLLRSCPEIHKIYLLIRPKKCLSTDERLKKLFGEPGFTRLWEQNPNFMDKVVSISGDLYRSDLGLSPEDRRCLVENVNIVIHNASVVYFEAKASFILRINVFATQKLLELAKECLNFDVFVYVSTAFSNPSKKTVEEEFYPSPGDIKMIEDIIRSDEENAAGITKEAIKDFVGNWYNLYTFSKAVAENIVQDFSNRHSLPCLIHRPSIVIMSIREPFENWLKSRNGPVILTIGMFLGILHVVLTDKHNNLDMVPVDMVINSLLASIWDYAMHRKSKGPLVYNYGSSDWNHLTFNGAVNLMGKWAKELPCQKMIWHPFVICTSNIFVFLVLHFFFHVIPAIFADLILLSRGQKPKAISALTRLWKNHEILTKFINANWIIRTDNVRRILNHMNGADLEEFQFDLKLCEWDKIARFGILKTRELLRDDLSTIPTAKKRYQRLKILHYSVTALLAFLLLFFLYKIMCTIFCFP